ncbi:MAG TPA: competence/damage-inducible protein A [Thermoanaerobaculia bacterium]|nr:competence/damage-inducible protein A [Thermoanaerobaculia bacterium]
MRAAILAVGTELLSVDRVDSHSLRLAARLERHGVDLVRKAVVADDEGEIAAEIAAALERADLLIVTGGLGPTADDLTREGCARALGLRLVEDPAVWEAIHRRFASFGRTPSENNRRQALVPEDASVLANARGTAPGLRLESGGRTLFLLPGVPHELEELVERELEPWLAARSSGGTERRSLRVAMRPESEVDRQLEPAYGEFGRESITVLASPGEVRVRFAAVGPEAERGARLNAMEARLRELLGAAVFGAGEEETLEAVVGALLAARGWTLATAESCTGGLVAERLTRVPGSSGWFPGGVVAYSNRVKTDLAGVDPELFAAHGAVSEPVARALAEGVRRRFAADLGIGITGIAGPGGGSAEKPVGTVHLALAAADGTRHRALRLPGDRERVRTIAAQAALEMVRRWLLGTDAGEAA